MPKRDDVTLALVRARERIADPWRWLEHQLALAEDGLACPPGHPLAHAWCAVGALMEEYTTKTVGADGALRLTLDGEAYALARRRLEAALPDDYLGGVEGFNDNKGHAAVLALYDSAIRMK